MMAKRKTKSKTAETALDPKKPYKVMFGDKVVYKTESEYRRWLSIYGHKEINESSQKEKINKN